MSFLGGAFLWALPLAAVPVVIHLMNRRRRDVVRWGAMRLLQESIPRRRRIWQINDLLLMIVRAVAVAAIVLALARPQVRSGVLSGKRPGRDVILIVDASLSTDCRRDDAPIFDKVKSKAAEIAANVDPADHLQVMVAASAPIWITANSASQAEASKAAAAKEPIAKQIAELKPSAATADMPACIQAALAAETPGDTSSRLIVVVADGSAHGWGADAGARWQSLGETVAHASVPTAVNVVFADVPHVPVRNLAVESITTNRTRVAAGEPFTLTARIRNTGDRPTQPTNLKWDVAGKACGEGAVPPLDRGQTADVTLDSTCDKPGAFALSATIVAADDLPGDNASSIVLESVKRLPILVCRGERAADQSARPDFLLAALGRRQQDRDAADSFSAFDPTVIDVNALGGTDLSRYRCVVLDDAIPAGLEVFEALSDFVSRGGGLWILLGENVTTDRFNAALYRDGTGLFPAALGKRVDATREGAEFTIHPPEGTHPATVLLGDTNRLDIDDARIKRHWQLLTPEAADEISVLLETGEGVPLAVERLVGDGRIIVQALPADTAWSNLPLCQSFVPLVQECVWYITQPSAVAYNIDPGLPIRLPSELARGRKSTEIRTPSGATEDLAASAADNEAPPQYRETLVPGAYRVKLAAADGAEQTYPFWVRRDPAESRLEPLSVEEIARLTGAAGLRFDVDPMMPPDNAAEGVRYQPLWFYLLALVGLLFVLESVVAHMLTRRRYADAGVGDDVVLPPARGTWNRGRRSA